MGDSSSQHHEPEPGLAQSLRLRYVLVGLGAVFAFAVVVPLVWLIALSHWPGKLVTPDLPGGLLATIGGLMGAIFTVGGLLVALVSLLTQLTVEQRVRSVMQQTFDDLTPRTERRLTERLTALTYLHEAQLALSAPEPDWNRAIASTSQAIHAFDGLQGARSQLGLALYQHYVASVYSEQICGDQPIRYSPLEKWAFDWLHDAETKDDDPEGMVAAALAVLSGLMLDTQGMMRHLTRAITSNPKQKDELRQHARSLIFLASGCQSNDPAQQAENLRALAQTLAITLPKTQEEIVQSLLAAAKRTGEQEMKWLVLGNRANASTLILQFPKEVRVVVNGTTMLAQAFYSVPQQQGFAQLPESGGPIPVKDLSDILLTSFVFICRSDAPGV